MPGPDERSKKPSTKKIAAVLGLAAAALVGLRSIASGLTTAPAEGGKDLAHDDHLRHGDSGHGDFHHTFVEAKPDPGKFIYEGKIRPPFVKFMTTTPTTELFNITKLFGAEATSLPAVLGMNQRTMSSAQKIAKLMIQQWQRDVIENGKGTAYEGVEDARQVSDLKTIAVENAAEMKELIAKGLDPAEAMRVIFREKVLIPLVVNHCMGMISETGLYKVGKIDYLTDGDPKKFEAQIAQLKSDEQFVRDMEEISHALNPEIMREFAKQISGFEWEKSLGDAVAEAPAAVMRPVTTKDLFGARDQQTRFDREKSSAGKKPPMGGAGGGLRGGR